MLLDPAARRHLEVLASTREGGKRGSLLDAIDSTRTAMGSRLLGRWLGQPLLDISDINARLDNVERFFGDPICRSQTRDALRDLPDVERITGRIAVDAATPRDLAALRRGARGVPAALRRGGAHLERRRQRAAASEAVALLAEAIADDPAPAVGEGGVIRAGFSTELDEARNLTGDVRQALAELETHERERSGIRSLRVAYNRVFGYYIEVSNANAAPRAGRLSAQADPGRRRALHHAAPQGARGPH